VNKLIVALAIAATGPSSVLAASLPEISQFAQSVCGDIPEGSLTRTSIQGKVEANAGILAKIVSGDANVSGTRTEEIYKGIPFDRLPDKIPTTSMCKAALGKLIFSSQSTKTLNKPDTPDTPDAPGGINQTGPNAQGTVININRSIGGSIDLTPVREYLKSSDIPPHDAGAYGLVVFQSKATPANRAKLTLVCNSFVAFFPRGETSNVPSSGQMITIWPIDQPNAPEVSRDDCNYVIDHYDLNAAEAAIKDAQHQHAVFSGEGPYLVGWSPSNARGVPDRLVLVVDMSNSNSQEVIDHQFLFWKQKIIEDPTLWRHGFSIQRFRAAIRDFANQYGKDLLTSIKLVGGK
jgi:hypothetical protein